MNTYVIQLAILFAVRQIAQFGDGIDWGLVKEDLKARIPPLVPGKILDSLAVTLALAMIDGMAAVIKGNRLKIVVDKLEAGDFDGAGKFIQDSVKNFWRPSAKVAEEAAQKDTAAALVAQLSTMDSLKGVG